MKVLAPINEGLDVVNRSSVMGEVLWTNSSPTSGFGAQTITLNKSLNNYNCYEIVFRMNTSNGRLFNTGKIPVGSGTILSYVTGSSIYRPTSTTVSGTTITFEGAKSGNSSDNSLAIPYKVIGYATGPF